MMERGTLITPETHPNHPVVGLCFKGWAGQVYFCDSFEFDLGFWMTRVDAPEDRRQDRSGEFRTNVSSRAIGATFHAIYKDGGGLWCQYGAVSPDALGPHAETGRYARESV